MSDRDYTAGNQQEYEELTMRCTGRLFRSKLYLGNLQSSKLLLNSYL